jgi:hypothetical protein
VLQFNASTVMFTIKFNFVGGADKYTLRADIEEEVLEFNDTKEFPKRMFLQQLVTKLNFVVNATFNGMTCC